MPPYNIYALISGFKGAIWKIFHLIIFRRVLHSLSILYLFVKMYKIILPYLLTYEELFFIDITILFKQLHVLRIGNGLKGLHLHKG